MKFTPDGGEIRLAANLADLSLPLFLFSDKEASNRIPEDKRQERKGLGKFVAISVIDTGIGINPENMERVLHVFEQVETSASRNYQGTGLGLPLTKRLVELHGGKLWVESDGEGKGSAFGFVIPTDLKPIDA